MAIVTQLTFGYYMISHGMIQVISKITNDQRSTRNNLTGIDRMCECGFEYAGCRRSYLDTCCDVWCIYDASMCVWCVSLYVYVCRERC